ncbi:MAG: sugar phosphate nucleotidyltransferase, partial [Candidatus Micrarchaeia archaeon]
MEMKGVVLVAGKGTRLEPFTDGISKCMLPVAGKPIMQYALETIGRLGIKEACIVLRDEHREHIQSTFGSSFGGVSLTYVEQDTSKKGTAAAVLSAKEFIGGSTALIMAGDILTTYEDVRRLC